VDIVVLFEKMIYFRISVPEDDAGVGPAATKIVENTVSMCTVLLEGLATMVEKREK
jgi:hypothetical protein